MEMRRERGTLTRAEEAGRGGWGRGIPGELAMGEPSELERAAALWRRRSLEVATGFWRIQGRRRQKNPRGGAAEGYGRRDLSLFLIFF
jgi:hypothetical protein